MIVSLTFLLLAMVAIAGAMGLLLSRRADRCVWSFGLVCMALGGMYLLFNNPTAAAIQVIGMFIWGNLLAVNWNVVRATRLSSPAWWALPVGVVLIALAGRAVLSGRIGAPLTGWPIWAVREDRLVALGRELFQDYTILIALSGLVLLTALVGVAWMRFDRQTDGEAKHDDHR